MRIERVDRVVEVSARVGQRGAVTRQHARTPTTRSAHRRVGDRVAQGVDVPAVEGADAERRGGPREVGLGAHADGRRVWARRGSESAGWVAVDDQIGVVDGVACGGVVVIGIERAWEGCMVNMEKVSVEVNTLASSNMLHTTGSAVCVLVEGVNEGRQMCEEEASIPRLTHPTWASDF